MISFHLSRASGAASVMNSVPVLTPQQCRPPRPAGCVANRPRLPACRLPRLLFCRAPPAASFAEGLRGSRPISGTPTAFACRHATLSLARSAPAVVWISTLGLGHSTTSSTIASIAALRCTRAPCPVFQTSRCTKQIARIPLPREAPLLGERPARVPFSRRWLRSVPSLM